MDIFGFELELENPLLWILWVVGMLFFVYMLKTLYTGSMFGEGNPEFFTIPKLILFGVIGAIVFLPITQMILNRG